MTRLSGFQYFLILIGMSLHKICSVWLTILSTISREKKKYTIAIFGNTRNE